MDGRLFFFITSSWMHRQQKSSMQKKFMAEKSWKLSSVRAERKTTTRYFQIFDIFLDNDIPYISWTRTSFRQSELSFRECLKIGCNKKSSWAFKKHFIFQCIFNLTYKLQHFLLNSKLERLQIPRAIFRTLMRRSLLFYSFCSHCKTSKKKLARAAFAEQKWQQDCPWHWTSGSGSMRGN